MAAPPPSPEPEPEEKENEERWLLTYSDMITLLVAVFVWLYSMSQTDIQKFNAFAAASRQGFKQLVSGNIGNILTSRSTSILPDGSGLPSYQKNQKPPPKTSHVREDIRLPPDMALFESINRQLAVLRLDGYFQPILDIDNQASNSYVVVVADNIHFTPGRAELSDGAREKLKGIGKVLASITNSVIVEGYCSSLASNQSDFGNSWLLSAARAANVIETLTADTNNSINPRRFVLNAYGEWQPARPSKKVALSGAGEWIDIPEDENASSRRDRVAVSVRYQGGGKKDAAKKTAP